MLDALISLVCRIVSPWSIVLRSLWIIDCIKDLEDKRSDYLKQFWHVCFVIDSQLFNVFYVFYDSNFRFKLNINVSANVANVKRRSLSSFACGLRVNFQMYIQYGDYIVNLNWIIPTLLFMHLRLGYRPIFTFMLTCSMWCCFVMQWCMNKMLIVI